jgi:hypothetical protein
MLAGRLASGYGLLEVAQAARAAPPPLQTPRGPDLLLDGLALVITEGYRAGVPTLKRALTAFRGDHVTTEEELRWLWFAGQTALELWDDEAWEVFATRQVQVAREVGALPVLALALNSRIGVHMGAGSSPPPSRCSWS